MHYIYYIYRGYRCITYILKTLLIEIQKPVITCICIQTLAVKIKILKIATCASLIGLHI